MALVGVAFSFSLRDYLTGQTAVIPAAEPITAVSTVQSASLPSGDTAVNLVNDAAATAVPPIDQPATPPADQSLPQPQSNTHTVQVGETMFRIATNYGVTVAELAAANGITDPSLLYVGQVLTIPGVPPPAATIPPADSTGGQPTSQPADQPINPLPPSPTSLNGIPLTSIVIMPPEVLDNARAIYARGQELGRNPHAFSKVGDSTIAIDHFLSRFDSGPYNLGDYAYLQRVIDYFPGSFARDSAAVRIGLHSWTVFDPIWADKSICGPNETSIACEFRLHNPSIILVRLGANDVGAPGLYAENMRQIVQFSIDNGVIPVLGTKADRNEGSNQNNDILRQIAGEYKIPLWEFDPVAGTLPGRGLDVDGVHMTTFYAHDYTQPEAFQRGHAMNNLTALMMLDALLTDVILPATP
ncbi:MAG: LysM peptidoglycan-binding domain-containing protein [Ardenticatenaceae bacterium]|nr:LysM peptidoglycan-binding domain-containing protein [Ardenticatenaceae bacterium]